jgi:ATP/maltotriose-dependent transcriptional regulator MalT
MAELITTKIVPPRRRPDLLDRPRLLNTLLENRHIRLIIVSAPAGYGKTSLLVDFAHRLDHPVCWYTVTESDGNVWTFARYIVGAIQQQIPEFGERSLQLLDREAEDLDALVTTLVNEIHALDRPLWLIIDDFHLIADAAPVRDFLEAFVPRLPDNCHLIIASRTVPDLGPKLVARLVARREIIGLGHEALRFTPEEIRTFLRDVYNHDISLDEARKLAEASEGWITAIILTSQVGDPLVGIVRARSAGGRLYEYLAAEVLDRLPPHIRNFLMESSVLGEMDPQVVNALLDIDDAAAILDALEQRNVFVTRLESRANREDASAEPRLWYRYHSLFREFLQAQLRETNPQRFWELQQRAARVLLEVGHRDQAIDHFLKAGAYENAAQAIEEETREMYTTAQADRIARWIDALPQEVLERHPRLLRHRAKICIERDGDPAYAIKLCEHAESLLRRNRNATELAWTLLEKASALRMQGRLSEVITCCKQALELAGEDEPAIAADAQRAIGLAQTQLGYLDKGVAALRAALDYWRDTDNAANHAILHNDLGTVLRAMGNLTASDLHFQKALEIWEALNDANRAAMTLNNLALGYHYQGKYNEALKGYHRALKYAREAASRRHGAYILIGMGDVYRDLGRYTDAVTVYKQGLLDARKVGDAFLGAYGLDALGQTYHLMGETQKGLALVRQAYEDARERGAKYEMALYQLSLGTIAHEEGFLDEAMYRLKRCIEHFQQGHLRELARANLHLAQTHHLAHRPQEMRLCIREAEVCLFRLGYDGFILPTLLRTAGAIHAAADTSPYLTELLQQAEKKLGPIPDVAQRSPQPQLRVHVLGRPRVYLGDTPLVNEDWNRQRVQELFFYLLTHPHRTAHQIGADLWPDLAPAKVTNNLYVTISRLRRALGNSDYVVSEEGRYALRVPQLWVDAHQFREAIELARLSPSARGEIQQLDYAVRLYRGDFLTDFPVSGDDSWIREERAELRRLYERALERLAAYWTAQGDEQRARQYTQRRATLMKA